MNKRASSGRIRFLGKRKVNARMKWCKVKNYTDIVVAFGQFKAKHPEASRFETRLRPAPWNELRSQPFKFVPNRQILLLFSRWKRQLERLLSEESLGPTQ
ncbi:MAG: hypothetical protein ACYCY6_01090 [Minisyncoccota bacterium]